jgi:uncharacterized protein (TIRG00374 family)
MNSKVKAVFFIVGLTLFIYLVTQLGIDEIVSGVKRTGWWMIPIVGVWLIVYLLNTWAWQWIMKAEGNKLPFRDLLSLSVSGFAMNYVTPFINLGGEPYKIMVLKDKIGVTKSVSSVVLYSMLHFLSSFVFWLVAILLVLFSLKLSSQLQWILIIGFAASALGIWFFYSRHKKGFVGTFFRLAVKLPITERWVNKIKLKEGVILEIDENIVSLYKDNRFSFYAALSLEFLARIVTSVEYLFILYSIGIEISFREAIYINAFSSFMINIFFFIPLTLGVREGSLFFIMGILKLTPATGIYIGIITRLRELFWIAIGLILIQIRKYRKIPNVSYKEQK